MWVFKLLKLRVCDIPYYSYVKAPRRFPLFCLDKPSCRNRVQVVLIAMPLELDVHLKRVRLAVSTSLFSPPLIALVKMSVGF